MIKHAFLASGYINDQAEEFIMPLEYWFEAGIVGNCSENCQLSAFIKCAHCENCFA